MNKYVFMIGWIAFSDGACGEDTGIQCGEDLVKKYKQDPDSVDSVIVEARDEQHAYHQGYSWAFFQNFTADNTISTLVPLSEVSA